MKDWKTDLRAIKRALGGGEPVVSGVPTNVRSGAVAERRRGSSVIAPGLNARSDVLAKTLVSGKNPKAKTDKQAPHVPREKRKTKNLPLSRTGPTEQAVSGSASRSLGKSVQLAAAQGVPTAKSTSTSPSPDSNVIASRSPPKQGYKAARRVPVPSTIQALRKVSGDRQRLFKLPEDWVATGAQTQLPGPATGRLMDIVIGVDFGTSYTKAAVGMMDKIYPVNWSGISRTNSEFLLPSEYTREKVGGVFLGQKPNATADEVEMDLKLPFIHPHVSMASIANAAVFLATVLRYVRAWIYRFHQAKIGAAKVRWSLNIGAPSNGLEDARLIVAYRRLGLSAWRLSQRPIDDCMADATDVVAVSGHGCDVHDLTADAVAVFPEFVAQMAGYVQSPERQPGLHALVDIGGGTLDVVTFIVHQVEHEDTFPFLVPKVTSLGTHLLNQNRVADVAEASDRAMPDELMPVLDAIEFAEKTGLDPDHVKFRDGRFFSEVRHVVDDVFGKTKRSRYRLSDAWIGELRTFLTGGGASISGYGTAIDLGSRRWARKIQLIKLPQHPRLADFHGTIEDYQRISVACGLAQDAFSLGRIIPAKDVEDDRPPSLQVRERPDRDELYAR